MLESWLNVARPMFRAAAAPRQEPDVMGRPAPTLRGACSDDCPALILNALVRSETSSEGMAASMPKE